MDDLIEELLKLARKGRIIDEPDAIELPAVAESAWETVSNGPAELHVETGSATLVGDEERVRELLENLYRNAIEHGGENVTVRVGTLENGFYVQDDGPGIPTEKQEEVFESGYTTSEDGTGLGLAIVREIAEAHDWEVRVTEGPDGGTRFEITGVRSV